MNTRWVFPLLFVLTLLLLAAGCNQTAAPPATPAPTAVETIATATPAPVVTTTVASSTPGPVQTLPDAWSIEVQVAGNGEAINPEITVTCVGGKGLNVVPQLDVKVTRPDGVVKTDSITKPLYKGKSVSLPITSQMGNVNRVEVWAIDPQGDKVKIFDDYVPFRTYN
jgi:hypothetical protein